MGLMNRLFGGGAAAALSAPRAYGVRGDFISMNDPRFLEMLREGVDGFGSVSIKRAMTNPAVFRSVSLISSAIGMLPLHLKDAATKENAEAHPLFTVLHRRPNSFQSAFDFRSGMQARALLSGDAYALVIRSVQSRTGKSKPFALIPLHPDRVTAKLDETTWQVRYEYRTETGSRRVYGPRDIFHLRGLSLNGVNGLSLVKQAADAIRLALLADRAVGNIFEKGSFVGGVLQMKGELSAEAYERLKVSWDEQHSGAGNAGSTPILEGEAEYKPIGASAKDSQSNETRGRQVEEIARVFGIPRPLLMVDETSWGSGIDVLGQFFVRYALNPWFEAWQQAIERTLLDEDEQETLVAKFNAGALLRGSMKDQGEFFAKAMGAGGHRPWMTANEVRDMLDMPAHADGDNLDNPMLDHDGGGEYGLGKPTGAPASRLNPAARSHLNPSAAPSQTFARRSV